MRNGLAAKQARVGSLKRNNCAVIAAAAKTTASLLFEHTDHLKHYSVNLKAAPNRINRSEQISGKLVTNHHHARAPGVIAGVEEPPALQ